MMVKLDDGRRVDNRLAFEVFEEDGKILSSRVVCIGFP